MKSIQLVKTLALVAATALFGLGAQAQGIYPDKSIRMVVPVTNSDAGATR